MKKLGFTLAEILATLGIIGVVVSLTMPVLNLNINKNIYASKVSATVSALESAFNTVIISNQANYLNEVNDFASKLQKVTKILNYEDCDTDNLRQNVVQLNTTTPKSTIIASFDSTNFKTFELPNGAKVYISTDIINGDIETIENEGGSLTDGYELAIDTNNNSRPNEIGRDIFYYILGTNGKLYPYGCDDVKNLLEQSENSKCETGDSLGCAYKLLQDNYKMDY